MSNQSEFPSGESDVEALRVRIILKKSTMARFNSDCVKEKREPHNMVAWIVEKYYEKAVPNG